MADPNVVLAHESSYGRYFELEHAFLLLIERSAVGPAFPGAGWQRQKVAADVLHATAGHSVAEPSLVGRAEAL